MNSVCFDGSFAGFLSLLGQPEFRKHPPDSIQRVQDAQLGLFASVAPFTTCETMARRYWQQFRCRTSNDAARTLLHAFFADREGDLAALYRFALRAEQLGPSCLDHHFDPQIGFTLDLAQKVRRETHRLKGLLRFRSLADGVFYAPVEPDHAILPMLAPHFARRFGAQPWLIHDLSRGQGVIYDGRSWVLGDIHSEQPLQLAPEELNFQELWQSYVDTIAIRERINRRLQQQFIPKKYWRHLVECLNQR